MSVISTVPTRSAHRVRRRRRARRGLLRRIRAVLAGGLVLGVGAGATLASWNDGEYSAATFTAGRFGIIGTAKVTDPYSDHNSAGSPAALTFAIPSGTVSAMVPGNTAYAMFSVKTINLSVAGTVKLIADPLNNAGLGAYLVYQVRTIAGTTCDSSTFAVGSDIPGLGTTAANVPLTSSATQSQPLAANGGSMVNYCFAVTLPSGADNNAQGATLAAKWTFLATAS